MPISGTPLWPTAVVGDAAGVWSWKAAAGTNNSDSKCGFGTTTTQGFKLVKPGLTNTDAVVTTIPAAAQGLGWHVQAADMDMAVADRPGRRRLPAGTYTFNCVFAGSTADTSTAFGIHVRIYRRLSGGTFSSVLGSGQTIGLSAVVGTADVDVPVTLSADAYFDTGETMHVEFWIRGRGGGATGLLAQTVSFHVGQAPATHTGSNDTQLAIPGGGLRYEYQRSHATTKTPTTAVQRRISLPDSRFATSTTPTSVMARAIVAARVIATSTTPSAVTNRVVTAYRAFATATAPTPTLGPRRIALPDNRFATSTTPTPAMAKLPNKVFALSTAPTVAMAKLLGKAVAVVATGVTGFGRVLTAYRASSVTTTPTTRLRLDLPEAALDRIAVGGPTDWPVTNPTRAIAGVVRDATGTPYAGATVALVRESDGFVCATMTSAADGTYSFARDTDDPYTYYVVASEATGTPTQGISARALAPV